MEQPSGGRSSFFFPVANCWAPVCSSTLPLLLLRQQSVDRRNTQVKPTGDLGHGDAALLESLGLGLQFCADQPWAAELDAIGARGGDAIAALLVHDVALKLGNGCQHRQ